MIMISNKYVYYNYTNNKCKDNAASYRLEYTVYYRNVYK